MRYDVIDYSNLLGKPIESLQTMLRGITFYYEDLPRVVPNGVFNSQTENAVKAFQKKFNLEITGIVNFVTWEKVSEIYTQAAVQTAVVGSVYPNEWFVIEPYESSEHLHTMQAMMKNIAEKFNNMGEVAVTGIHKDDSIAMIKRFQEIFGMDETGTITNELWRKIENMYINEVVNNIFK